MLIITHGLIGGMLGKLIGNPWIAFPAGLISHFLADKIPHYWPKGRKNNKIYATIDVIISLLLIPIYWFSGLHNIGFWSGFIGASMVDFILGNNFTKKSNIGRWHEGRQPHRSDPIYILTDIAASLLSLVMLL